MPNEIEAGDSSKEKTSSHREERLVRFFLPCDHPDENERVIVHVPLLDRRERGDGDGIYIGRFIHKNLNEWRIEGSNSEWEIDWWCRIPEPNARAMTPGANEN
jgi:hypothetical protein